MTTLPKWQTTVPNRNADWPGHSPASDRGIEDRSAVRMAVALAQAEDALATVDALDREFSDAATTAAAATVSIVIPVYNERATIREIVRRVQAVGLHDEILIVDDFSMDGTRDVLLELAEDADVRVFMHGYNRGKGAALRTGFGHARGDVIAIQDADLEYHPRDLASVLEPILRGEADVAYGSRFLEDPQQDPSRWHRLGNWLLTRASNLATGQRLTDMETCYKAFRRSILDRVALEQDGFGFEPEITGKVSRLGCAIVERPIHYASRSYEAGKKIGLRDAVHACWCIAKYRCRRGDRRPT